jgi:hypothetical protein
MSPNFVQEQEFQFEILNKKIITIHNTLMGKRNCLFDHLKANDNIYGIQKDLAYLQTELNITELSNYKTLQLILSSENPDDIIKILNFIYLQNNYYTLFLCLFHKLSLVRKTAITLLMNGFEINPLIMSFFQSAFNLEDPYLVLVFPEEFKLNCIKHLNRETVRWLTSLNQKTSQNLIWQRYSQQDILLSIETQKKSTETIEESFAIKSDVPISSSISVASITKWIQSIPENPDTIIADQMAVKLDKVYSLRAKWLNSNSRLKTAHKILERLFEKWEENNESEFAKAFQMFISGMSKEDRQIFFIFGASSEHLNIMTLSFKYITEISPISSANIFSNRKTSQNYIHAIFQAKYFGESENKNPMFLMINEHFDDLIVQLKEVEDIFIPSKKETDDKFAIPLLESITKAQTRMVKYPHHKGYFKSFHFEPGKPSKKFAQQIVSEPCSALEIQAISGIAIVLTELKTRSTPLPMKLLKYEINTKLAFKPSNKFEPKYLKLSKKSTSKKEKTLADIFGTNPTVEDKGNEFTLEQILNTKPNKKKPE